MRTDAQRVISETYNTAFYAAMDKAEKACERTVKDSEAAVKKAEDRAEQARSQANATSDMAERQMAEIQATVRSRLEEVESGSQAALSSTRGPGLPRNLVWRLRESAIRCSRLRGVFF